MRTEEESNVALKLDISNTLDFLLQALNNEENGYVINSSNKKLAMQFSVVVFEPILGAPDEWVTAGKSYTTQPSSNFQALHATNTVISALGVQRQAFGHLHEQECDVDVH